LGFCNLCVSIKKFICQKQKKKLVTYRAFWGDKLLLFTTQM